jgi:copper(I)-binding protein
MRYANIVLLLSIVPSLVATGCRASPSDQHLKVEDAWARPVPMAGGNGAVYLRLINTGGDADQLVGGECSTAKAVEFHI